MNKTTHKIEGQHTIPFVFGLETKPSTNSLFSFYLKSLVPDAYLPDRFTSWWA
jgi:hypothetical protein